MAQQTAVEWLFEKITSNFWDIKECQHLLEQAKQVEKEQIEKAWWAGHDERDANYMVYPSEDCNQYYNYTYNK